jgi:hypothetical protein
MIEMRPDSRPDSLSPSVADRQLTTDFSESRGNKTDPIPTGVASRPSNDSMAGTARASTTLACTPGYMGSSPTNLIKISALPSYYSTA